MLKRKNLYTILGTAGALVLLLGGLSVSVVSAQEVTPPAEDAPAGGIFGRGRVLFDFGPGGGWTMFDTVAEELSLTPEELFTKLHDGQTVEGVAEAQGVDLEALRDTLEANREEARREAIEQAVEDGNMTQEEADWLLEGLDNGFMPHGGGFGHGRGRGMRGGRGMFAPGGFAPGGISPQSTPSAPAVPGSSSL
jgi:hypothetical protein